ncbi:MAG: hypothetical protein LLF76_12150 [Planctomycetaceae bacterium]|nr:hypothetical protein [Planctomycetaceae bacterium]
MRYKLFCKRSVMKMCLLSVLLGQYMFTTFAFGSGEAITEKRRPLRLLSDEYHQFPNIPIDQRAFPTDTSSYRNGYRYAIDSAGTPNGLFWWSQLIRDDFRAATTQISPGPDLMRQTDAYLIICPRTAAKGNAHPLNETDAQNLQKFVAEGGILILVYNSIDEPNNADYDFYGMNLIAKPFGLEFQATGTGILAIPIPPDHPQLFGLDSVICGDGCTLAFHPQADSAATVLLESTNPKVPGPVAIRVRYKKGTVLAIGDGGIFGNAHMTRDDIGHAAAVKRLMHCLLPEGPLPGYGFSQNQTASVQVKQEMTLAGYPEALRLFDMPFDASVKIGYSEPPQLDTRAGDPSKSENTENRPSPHIYGLAKMANQWNGKLIVGAKRDRTFAVRWQDANGAEIAANLTARGELLEAKPTASALDSWRQILLNDVWVNPIDPYAQVGYDWESPAMIAIPNSRLLPEKMIMRRQTAQFNLESSTDQQGRPCFVVSRLVNLPLNDLKPQDLVDPVYADYFDQMQISLVAQGCTALMQTWVDKAVGLPIKTQVQVSASFWWSDRKNKTGFIGTHDWLTHETETLNYDVVTISRKLWIDFNWSGVSARNASDGR